MVNLSHNPFATAVSLEVNRFLHFSHHPFSSLSNHAVGRRDRRDRSHV